MTHFRERLLFGIVAALPWTSCWAEDAFVAGLEPHQRPANAPVISTVERDGDWFKRALTGISRPYPASLRFLDDQGNWYTPFNRPGMPARYDIRGWHQSGDEAGVESR